MPTPTITQQVTNLELSQKLKELGVPQESVWYHVHDLMGGTENEIKLGNPPKDHYSWAFFSAPTVAELVSIFEKSFNEWSVGYNDSGCFYHFTFGGRGSGNMIEEIGIKFSALDLDDETLADSMALALTFLIENGHLDVTTL